MMPDIPMFKINGRWIPMEHLHPASLPSHCINCGHEKIKGSTPGCKKRHKQTLRATGWQPAGAANAPCVDFIAKPQPASQ